jgi:hypothetical protein
VNTVPRIVQVRDRLRSRGFTVVEVAGWENRGRGEFLEVRGQFNHHDAFPARTGHAGGLRTCTFGRSDLPNSLCMFYLGSDGVVYVVAARVSWQTGSAMWKGVSAPNSRWCGIEARNDGVGESWPKVQLDAYAALNEETCKAFGFGADMLPDHKEAAVPRGRKPDRYGIDPVAWRARIAAALHGTPVPAPPPPPAPPEPPKDWFDMASKEELQQIVDASVKAQVDVAITALRADIVRAGEQAHVAAKARDSHWSRLRGEEIPALRRAVDTVYGAVTQGDRG